jgi:hypothetical protein
LPNQPIIQDEAEVVMTPKVLKYLSLALVNTVEALENAIGKIELSPQLLELLKSVQQRQQSDAVEAAAKQQAEEKS